MIEESKTVCEVIIDREAKGDNTFGSVCLSVCLSVHLSVRPSVCLSALSWLNRYRPRSRGMMHLVVSVHPSVCLG